MPVSSYRRRLSGIERGYLNAATQAPHPVIHLVLEADGLLSGTTLEGAVAAAAARHPGMTVLRRGAAWVSGGTIPVHVHDTIADVNQVTAFHDDIDVTRGPVTSVQLFRDEREHRTRLVVRASHTITDGRGMEQFLLDLARHLRGEDLTGAGDTLIDTDVVALADARRRHPHPPAAERRTTSTRSPVAGPGVPDAALRWSTRHVPATVKGLTGRIGAVLAAGLDEPATVVVPVNLRRHARSLQSSANLSAQLPLPLHPGEQASDIQSRLMALLLRNRELDALRGDYRTTNPFAATLEQAQRVGRDGHYPCLAIISDHGHFDLGEFHTPTLRPTRLYTLPMLVPYAGMFISCFSHDGGCDITITHRRSDDPVLVEQLLDRVAEAITSNLTQGAA